MDASDSPRGENNVKVFSLILTTAFVLLFTVTVILRPSSLSNEG